MRIICCIIISPSVVSIIVLVWDSWGSFEINCQMAPSLSQPFVSYQHRALHQKQGENVQAMKILAFYSSGKPEIDELLNVRLHTNLHTAFGFFSLLDDCHWNRGVE